MLDRVVLGQLRLLMQMYLLPLLLTELRCHVYRVAPLLDWGGHCIAQELISPCPFLNLVWPQPERWPVGIWLDGSHCWLELSDRALAACDAVNVRRL